MKPEQNWIYSSMKLFLATNQNLGWTRTILDFVVSEKFFNEIKMVTNNMKQYLTAHFEGR